MTDYSVIIPAFNEAALIASTIRAVQASMQHSLFSGEIIVVDNDSTDKTAEIAASMGARVVHEPFRQIARARNSGARAAQGRYLIFVDADTIIAEPLLNEALRLLVSGKVAGGGARVEFDRPQRFLAAALLRYWQMISRAARLAAGCFVFCTAEGFRRVGGFDEKVYASEEIGFSVRLRAWAHQHRQIFKIINRQWLKTSARKNQNVLQLILTILVIALFPAAVRFRSLCFLWYACRHSDISLEKKSD
ncbi:MAG: hypothetical protein A2W80_16340 [Candidatus Riflebacteria bacterium GWC2_50_8]|nr:MAG: hypothetical protein A2W80_16340 [Candidatus Riflebacteria bacterium GWC2_50_8]